MHNTSTEQQRSSTLYDMCAGVPGARERFIEQNLGLVTAIASTRGRHGEDYEDIFQEGVIGLMRAVDKFDPERGIRFSTYATWWIRQAIDSAIERDSDVVRRPTHHRETLKKLHKAREALGAACTTHAALAEAAGVQEQTAKKHLFLLYETESLSESYYVDTLADDGIPVEEAAIAALGTSAPGPVASLLGCLSQKERFVVSAYFGLCGQEPHTLRAIGAALGTSHQRAAQLKNNAIEKIKKTNEARMLRQLVE